MKQLEQANRDIETALAAASTDDLKAEAHYVRSLAALKAHLTNVGQPTVAEAALLQLQRDLLQAVKLMPANSVYQQTSQQLFDFATKYSWTDAARKMASETIQRDFNALRPKP